MFYPTLYTSETGIVQWAFEYPAFAMMAHDVQYVVLINHSDYDLRWY